MSIAAICRPEVIAVDAGASLRDFGVISVMGESGASNAVAEVTRLIGRPPLMNAAFKSREVADDSCGGNCRRSAKPCSRPETVRWSFARPRGRRKPRESIRLGGVAVPHLVSSGRVNERA